MSHSKIFVLLILIITFLSIIHSFNLSPVPNIIIKKPFENIVRKQERSSYFGFSIVLREKSIIIGAPRAQSTLLRQWNVDEPGVIYRCPFTKRLFNFTVNTCAPFVFELGGNIMRFSILSNAVRDRQWLGASMDGSSKDSETLLVCAPRFAGFEPRLADFSDNLQGICYSSENTLTTNPENIKKLKPFLKLEDDLLLAQKYSINNFKYQLGQLGFSAHVTPTNEKYVMGSPGAERWAGGSVLYNINTDTSTTVFNLYKDNSYLLGYAVGSGYLNSHNREIIYVSAAPHMDTYIGEVYLYRYMERSWYSSDIIDYIRILKGSQLGSFYGYAVLVCDVNGDNVDDILVTAPQYRNNEQIEVGALYVYINKGRFQFTLEIIESPFKSPGRFGTTIMSLGDVNRDGFNDVAVGAPFANGNGAVVIYHGSRNGLDSRPTQILKLPNNIGKFNNYFGHGLSKGVDIDGNGYTDLAVGAPNDETVYIYRAYPIVKISADITSSQSSIELNSTNIDYTVCYHINGVKTKTPLEFSFGADGRYKRLKFETTGNQYLTLNVSGESRPKCFNVTVAVTLVSSQIFFPINTTMSYRLIDDGGLRTGQEFCSKCFVTDPRDLRLKTSVVRYNHGCTGNLCDVDLSIKSNLPSKIIVGALKVLKVVYDIINRGEKAFYTQVNIFNSLGLPFLRLPPNCIEITSNELSCEISKDMYAFVGNSSLEIEYILGNVDGTMDLNISANITSTGNELNQEDNSVFDTVHFEMQSQVEVLGTPNEALITMDDSKSSFIVDFNFKIQNLGPSIAKNLNIAIHVPVNYVYEINKPLKYADISEINISDFEEHTNFTNDANDTKNFMGNTTEMLESLESLGLNQSRILLQSCHQPNTTECATSVLYVGDFEVYRPLNLQIKINFDASSVRKLLTVNQNVLGIFIDVTAKLSSDVDSSLNLTKVIRPIAINFKVVLKSQLFWFILGAVIGGVLLLALISYGFFKMGFFNRLSEDDMQRILDEKDDENATEIPTVNTDT